MSVIAAVRPTRSTRWIGWVPFALVALVVIPAISGSLRLVELAGGDQLLPANSRITASPVPVVMHILCAVAYAILGAFQFSGALRRRWPGWHRVAGRVLVVLGLAVAFSALWMTQFYPGAPGGELDGLLAFLGLARAGAATPGGGFASAPAEGADVPAGGAAVPAGHLAPPLREHVSELLVRLQYPPLAGEPQ